MKRRRKDGKGSKMNLVISTSIGRFVTAFVQVGLRQYALPTKTLEEMRWTNENKSS